MVQRHQDVHTGHQGSHHGIDSRAHSDLRAPVRNNYFYGKLLDVFHLEMEQEYFNAKRHLLNRLANAIKHGPIARARRPRTRRSGRRGRRRSPCRS